MQLSQHFSLEELCVTSTGLPNTPSPHAVEALRELCDRILEPWRLVVGPLRVTSGYRSPPVNARVGGSPTSQHLRGEAADVVPLSVPLETAWRTIAALADDLVLDQAICYQRAPNQGWIHVSSRANPRRELLVQLADGKTYVPWKAFRGSIVVL